MPLTLRGTVGASSKGLHGTLVFFPEADKK